MKIVPLELREANELVLKWHRHHKPVQGHRFSIGVINNAGELVGVGIVGRPVARLVNCKTTLEVTRTDQPIVPQQRWCKWLISQMPTQSN